MGQAKPLPILRGEEQHWFDAARKGRLIYQKCADCGMIPSYPRGLCSSCWSSAIEEKDSAGNGVVYSFTVQYKPGAPEFADRVPYIVALIDLDEGVRMLSDLRGCDIDTVTVGLQVEAFFDDSDDPFPLPHFRPRTIGVTDESA